MSDIVEITITDQTPISLNVSVQGTQGPAGTSNITTSTPTNITGLLYGNGTAVSQATTEQVRTAADLPSALSPYLLAALAASTYVPQSRTITINGTTQDLTANRTWTITTTPAAGSITNAMLANIATSSIKGRISASTGVVEDLTPAQARTVMGLATTDAPTFAGATLNGNLTVTGGRFVLSQTVESGNLIDVRTVGYTPFTVSFAGQLSCAGISTGNVTWNGNNGADASFVYTPTLALRGTGGAYVTDTCVTREGVGIHAFRSFTNPSTTAQRINIYGSFVDSANFRRLFISSTTAGAFAMGIEGLGTGASGNTLTITGTPIFSGGQLVLGTGMFPSWVRNDGTWGTVISTGASGTGGVGVAVSSMLPAGVSMSLGEIGFSGWSYLLLLSGGQGGILRPNGAGVLEVRNAANNAFGALNLANLTASGSQINFTGLPTTNPGVAGRLWNDGGTLKVS
jgi:hypothetical protein